MRRALPHIIPPQQRVVLLGIDWTRGTEGDFAAQHFAAFAREAEIPVAALELDELQLLQIFARA